MYHLYIDESDSEDDLSETEDPEDSRPDDVNAGCTIFIRNLGYRTDQKALFEAFRKYGHIEFVKIVIDKETGMSRGTAFLKFKSSESANAAVAAGSVSESGKKHDKKFSGTSDGIIVDDRLLSVALAVDRSEAGRLLEDNKKRKEDKRHLYLANEGRITEDSDLGKSMPKVRINALNCNLS
jgi:nucleolar protein 4